MKKEICFILSPIGEENSKIRKRTNSVYEKIIKTVVEPKYKALRGDEIDEPGLITRQVIKYIINSPLVIADLSNKNPNVFYELGIRHTLRKPTILIMTKKKGEKSPFDTYISRTIYYNMNRKKYILKAQKDILKQLKVIENNDFEIDYQIPVEFDLRIAEERKRLKNEANLIEDEILKIQKKVLESAKFFNEELKKFNNDEDKFILQDIITLLSNVKTAVRNAF